jgi:hypothetical protein
MSRSLLVAFVISLFLVGILLCGAGAGLAYLAVPKVPRKYATAIFSFAVPAGWTCRREGSEHVCDFGPPPFDSMVVLTMKYRGPNDNLEVYEDHLRNPNPFRLSR